MKFMKRFVALLLAMALLGLPAGALAASGNIGYEFALAVHSISTEQYIRHIGAAVGSDQLGPDEYYAIYITLHNYGNTDFAAKNCVLKVDDQTWDWGDSITVAAGSAHSLWLSHEHMRMIDRGEHTWSVSVGGAVQSSGSFFMPRKWGEDVLRLPTAAEIAGAATGGRAHYLTAYLGFTGLRGFTEYAADLRCDTAPVGTYLCPLSWWYDTSEMAKQYESIYNDYTGIPGGYFGFQMGEKGSNIIMTIWTAFCREKSGNVVKRTAKLLYPEGLGEEYNDSAEGSFVHCVMPYDWKVGKTYRVLLQQSLSEETGNVLVDFWICDLAQRQWTRVMQFDSGMWGIWMSSGAAFLEDFSSGKVGEVRTMEMFNIRVRDVDSGRWVSADQVSFLVDGAVDPVDGHLQYRGSSNFGVDGDIVWMASSGVEGLCRTPGKLDYSVKPGESSDPY